MNQAINIIFDGPPAHESGRFIEVETDAGAGIGVGEWIEKEDGLWALRISSLPSKSEVKAANGTAKNRRKGCQVLER